MIKISFNKIKKGLLFLFSFIFLQVFCTPKVPEQWYKLGVPQNGIKKINKKSNQNGFYAEYKNFSPKDLMNKLTQNLESGGFTEICNKSDLGIKGFKKNEEKYVVKIDGGVGRTFLSIANENGDESIFYGICFKGYKLGEPTKIK